MTGARGERLTAGGRAQLTLVVRENLTEADTLHGFSIRAKAVADSRGGYYFYGCLVGKKNVISLEGILAWRRGPTIAPLKTGDSFQKSGWLMHSCLRQLKLLFLAPSDTGEEGNK